VVENAIKCSKTGQWNCGWADYTSITKDVIFSFADDSAVVSKAFLLKNGASVFTMASNIGQAAQLAGDALHKLLDLLTENAATRSKISIHNRLTTSLWCTSTHSYQMNLWDNQFPTLHAWEGKDVNIWTSSNTWGWSDTNAEAYYQVWCPDWNRHLTFIIMVRHQRWIRFKWDERDVYNPCYDMYLEGYYYTSEKCDGCYYYRDVYHSIASASNPILVVGSYEVYNKETHVTVKLKPAQANSRYPMLYEHSNFHGIAHPIRTPFIRNLASFNDKASSLRVPPGMSVALCEHSDYNGHCQEYDQDTSLLSWNDAASSLIWCVQLDAHSGTCR
jgi:hypothetical protein